MLVPNDSPMLELESSAALSLWEEWPVLSDEERVERFRALPPDEADEFFLSLAPVEQATLILALSPGERRLWFRLLPPDDAADLIQEAPPADRENFLDLLDDATRTEGRALLAYADDEAVRRLGPRVAGAGAGRPGGRAGVALERAGGAGGTS